MSPEDAFYDSAKELVAYYQNASSTMLQRELKIGYERAARLIEMLEDNEVIGPARGVAPRKILIDKPGGSKPVLKLPGWYTGVEHFNVEIEEDIAAVRKDLAVLGFKIVNNTDINLQDIPSLPAHEIKRYFNAGLNRLGVRPPAPPVNSENGTWHYPDPNLLSTKDNPVEPTISNENADKIMAVLAENDTPGFIDQVDIGPRFTLYTVFLFSRVEIKRVKAIHKLLLVALEPGTYIYPPKEQLIVMKIAIPHAEVNVATVWLKDLLLSTKFIGAESQLTIPLGKSIIGDEEFADLAQAPHTLTAGASGSGRSAMLDSLLISLLCRNSPNELKLILFDTRGMQFSQFHDIPHLEMPIITGAQAAIAALQWAVNEMGRRIRQLADSSAPNFKAYNLLESSEPMPLIVIVIDEIIDVLQANGQDTQKHLERLFNSAQIAGIHLVLSTASQTHKTLPETISGYLPTRIAFNVASKKDSFSILDCAGAEDLLGGGDMLYQSQDTADTLRIQTAYIDPHDVYAVCQFLRTQQSPLVVDGQLGPLSAITGAGTSGLNPYSDPLFIDALKLTIETGKTSAALLQRRLKIGYARAALLIDILEDQGVVGPANGASPRDVLIADIKEVEGFENGHG